MPSEFRLTDKQAAQIRELVYRYKKPKREKPWARRTETDLWLRVLSQIVVAGNAAPGETLRESSSVHRQLAYSRLKRLAPRRRRDIICRVFRAIGTRYVSECSRKRNPKVDAAVQNFAVLVAWGGPHRFFRKVASIKKCEDKVRFLSEQFQFFKKKGCRDILIDLRLSEECLALDQRITGILKLVGVAFDGSLNSQYEKIERELLDRIARPMRLSGGQLDRILFRNYADIKVRLLC